MRLYLKFFSIHFRSAMTYRASFFLSCQGHLLITTNVFLSVVFLLDRFGSLGGYTMPQLSLCYAVILAATSLAECFGRGFDAFTRILAQAQFDRIMVRPRSLFFQVLCQDMKPTMLARVLQAAVMLGFMSWHSTWKSSGRGRSMIRSNCAWERIRPNASIPLAKHSAREVPARITA